MESRLRTRMIGRTFGCDNCDAASISISGELTDAADVFCTECGFHFGPWSDVRTDIERRMQSSLSEIVRSWEQRRLPLS